jgi:hypothetical protein
MTRPTSPPSKALYAFWLLLFAAAFSPASSQALTTVLFGPVSGPLTNEIATLQSSPDPSPSERSRLRALDRAAAVFNNPSLGDGKALRLLKNRLNRFPDYRPLLDNVASNLVTAYNTQYEFVGGLIPELPPSPEATAVAAQYDALANTTSRLNSNVSAARTAALYDAAKRRLDNIFIRANQALIVPFPTDLVHNQVKARIDNGTGPTTFTASEGTSSLNVFTAVKSGDTISLTISAVESTRGILFSIPNVQLGTSSYEIPTEVSFTNRTDFNFFTVPPTATDVAATEGTIFVSTTATEVYGIFECSGPGFTLITGRFRVDITEP